STTNRPTPLPSITRKFPTACAGWHLSRRWSLPPATTPPGRRSTPERIPESSHLPRRPAGPDARVPTPRLCLPPRQKVSGQAVGDTGGIFAEDASAALSGDDTFALVVAGGDAV